MASAVVEPTVSDVFGFMLFLGTASASVFAGTSRAGVPGAGNRIVDEAIVFGVLLLSLVMFVTAIWRYDIVALLALLVLTIAGIVPATEAYRGFGHPAVVTVAVVLVLSRALYNFDSLVKTRFEEVPAI